MPSDAIRGHQRSFATYHLKMAHMVVERMRLDETYAQVEASARRCRELHEPAQRDACAMLVGAPRTRWP